MLHLFIEIKGHGTADAGAVPGLQELAAMLVDEAERAGLHLRLDFDVTGETEPEPEAPTEEPTMAKPRDMPLGAWA